MSTHVRAQEQKIFGNVQKASKLLLVVDVVVIEGKDCYFIHIKTPLQSDVGIFKNGSDSVLNSYTFPVIKVAVAALAATLLICLLLIVQ